MELFTRTETFLTPALAEHYGATLPGEQPAWVSYQRSDQAGILSHGTFLSQGVSFGDTSPTQRGLLVRTRLMCEDVPELTPEIVEALGIDVDAEPTSQDPNACQKRDKWPVTQTSCSGCHAKMDSIGFGLEKYDLAGVHRETEPDDPSCTIDDQGEVIGLGSFRGPRGLADLLIQSRRLDLCMVRQLAHFALGRMLEVGQMDHGHLVEATDIDVNLQTDLLQIFREGQHSFKQLLVEFVSSDAFSHKRI